MLRQRRLTGWSILLTFRNLVERQTKKRPRRRGGRRDRFVLSPQAAARPIATRSYPASLRKTKEFCRMWLCGYAPAPGLPSDDVIGCENALRRKIGLDLQGRMVDPEIRFQLPCDLHQEHVARMTRRHDKMRRQADFSRADRPDVQVMQLRDAGARAKIFANACGIDCLGYGVERHIDALPQKAPGAPDNDRHDGKARDRIE